MAEEERSEDIREFELIIPPGVPNLETLLSEVIERFNLKLISPKDLDDPYYLAVRGDLESVQAAKEYIRKKLEERVEDMEKKLGTSK